MADEVGTPDPDRVHRYTVAERREQLRRFAAACERVAESFDAGRHPGADDYRRLATSATELLTRGDDHDPIKELAKALPPEELWMDARNPGQVLPRQPWQDDATRARIEADHVALEMRAWATYDPR